MGTLGEVNLVHYIGGTPLIIATILIGLGAILIFGSILPETKRGWISTVLFGGVLMLVGVITGAVDGSITKTFYQENGEQFLKDAGIQFVKEEKYQESDHITTDLEIIDEHPRYEGQKIRNIHISHLIKDSDKKVPEIKIELENGAVFLIEDGEKLLKSGDTKEQELYFLLNLKDDLYQDFAKEGNQWVLSIDKSDVQLIRGEEEMERTIKSLNS